MHTQASRKLASILLVCLGSDEVVNVSPAYLL